MSMPRNTPDKFWLNVHKTDDCWLWSAGCTGAGYGGWQFDNKFVLAHRFSYELIHGPVPKDICVLHKCDNPPCVRPDHLFLGTHADNARDRDIKGRAASRLGVGNGSAKLTESDVREIRYLYTTGGWTHRSLSLKYGVTQTPVQFLLQGKTWKHVN